MMVLAAARSRLMGKRLRRHLPRRQFAPLSSQAGGFALRIAHLAGLWDFASINTKSSPHDPIVAESSALGYGSVIETAEARLCEEHRCMGLQNVRCPIQSGTTSKNSLLDCGKDAQESSFSLSGYLLAPHPSREGILSQFLNVTQRIACYALGNPTLSSSKGDLCELYFTPTGCSVLNFIPFMSCGDPALYQRRWSQSKYLATCQPRFPYRG